jgi:hypothetical protein
VLRNSFVKQTPRCHITGNNKEDLRFSRRSLLRTPSSELLYRLALVRADVSEERIASIIRVTRIGELVTTSAATTTQ